MHKHKLMPWLMHYKVHFTLLKLLLIRNILVEVSELENINITSTKEEEEKQVTPRKSDQFMEL